MTHIETCQNILTCLVQQPNNMNPIKPNWVLNQVSFWPMSSKNEGLKPFHLWSLILKSDTHSYFTIFCTNYEWVDNKILMMCPVSQLILLFNKNFLNLVSKCFLLMSWLKKILAPIYLYFNDNGIITVWSSLYYFKLKKLQETSFFEYLKTSIEKSPFLPGNSGIEIFCFSWKSCRKPACKLDQIEKKSTN